MPPPGEQRIWVASAEGSGRQTLTWDVEGGNWSIVLMNADGSRGVEADVRIGVKINVLPWIILGVGIGALVMLGFGLGTLVPVMGAGLGLPWLRARARTPRLQTAMGLAVLTLGIVSMLPPETLPAWCRFG